MAGNITGSVLNSVALDSVTATQNLTPSGQVVVKAGVANANAGLFTTGGGAVVGANYAGTSGMWGATWNGAVTWTPSGTGSTGSSYNIATVTGLANSLSGNEKVAVFWTAGGVNYAVYDGSLASVTGTGFVATFATGQTALPATGTTITLSTNMDAAMSFNGNYLDQLLNTASQPGIINLYDSGPTMRRSSVISVAGGFDGWPTASGQTTPLAYTIATARFYFNSLVTSVAYSVALVE